MGENINKIKQNNSPNKFRNFLMVSSLFSLLTMNAWQANAAENFSKNEKKDNTENIYDKIENKDAADFEAFRQVWEKLPKKMKKLYKKISRLNSKEDFDDLSLDKEELWYLANIAPRFLDTKKWEKFLQNLQEVFGYWWKFDVYTSDFGGLKLVNFTLWWDIIFSINNTLTAPEYNTRKVDGQSIVIDKIWDRLVVRKLNHDILEWWFVIHYNGNLSSTDENWDHKWKAFLYRDTWFKNNFWELNIDPTKSPKNMIKYKYEKKKYRLSNIDSEIKSLRDMWYSLVWNDQNMTCRLKKWSWKSDFSDPILSYKSDRDFEKWMKDAKDVVDWTLEYEQWQEELFAEFYEKYFEYNWTLKDNQRYKIEREWNINFYLLDRYNRNKKIWEKPISIIDNKWKMISDESINIMINKYEAEEIYLSFISKNNKNDVLNTHWEHKVDQYYVWYDFLYKWYRIRFDRSSFTDWKYSVMVYDKDTEKYVWHFSLDNQMSWSDIEKEIEKIIK